MENRPSDYLYSPFRPKSVNPKDWDYKMNFWLSKIKEILNEEKAVIVRFEDVCSYLKNNNKIPHGMKEIFEELLNKRIIIPYEEASSDNYETWLEWGKENLFRYSKSLISYLPLLSYNQTYDDKKYVVKDNLEKISTCIYKLHDLANDTYKSVKQIRENCLSLGLKDEDIELSLIYLNSKGLVYIEDLSFLDNPNTLIKFIHSKHKDKNIDRDTNLNILKLKKIEKLIETEIENLSLDIEKCIVDAKAYLKSQNRNKAKSAIKQKLMHEERLRKKETILENIKNMIGQIHESHSNKMIYDAYKSSIDAYRKSMANSQLDKRKIDETLDEIQEFVDTQSDIQNALADTSMFEGPSGSLSSGDLADELEKELEELVRLEAEQQGGAKEQPSKISSPTNKMYPALPSSSPLSTTIKSQTHNDIRKILEEMDLEDLLPDVPTTDLSYIEGRRKQIEKTT